MGRWRCVAGGDGCKANAVREAAIAEGLPASLVPLPSYWAFRDDFLSEYTRGQEYIGYYYLWSVESEPVTAADLPAYIALIPEIDDFIEALMHGSETDIVINESLMTKLLAVIDSERRNTNKTHLIRILNAVENDVLTLAGLTRHEFAELFLTD